jgi:Domain of Unknown Function (DUF1080)
MDEEIHVQAGGGGERMTWIRSDEGIVSEVRGLQQRRRFLKNAMSGAAGLAVMNAGGVGLLAATGDHEGSASSGFRPLFDGKTLSGWTAKPRDVKKPSTGIWTVQNGIIIGGQEKPGLGAYLVSDEAFSDFELEIEARTDWPTDTGVYVRTNAAGNVGFQVGLDYRPHGAIGGYYGNGLGGFHACDYCFTGELDARGRLRRLVPEKPSEPLDATRHVALDYAPSAEQFLRGWRLNGWNRFRIRSVGAVPHLTTWINGMKVAELDTVKMTSPGWDPSKVIDLVGRSGHISLEIHNNGASDWLKDDRWAPGAVCRWRNISIKTL